MARNYSNIKYETFYQASEAAKRRCEKEGVSDDYYAVYAHWDEDGNQTWRISTHKVWLERWTRNRCGQDNIGRKSIRKAQASDIEGGSVISFAEIRAEAIPEVW